MQFNTELSIDLDNVEKYITSDKFAQFLLNTTTDFWTAAFILQTLLDRVKELKGDDKNG